MVLLKSKWQTVSTSPNKAINATKYGKVVPSALVLIALADFYDVSLDYLVGRSDDPARH